VDIFEAKKKSGDVEEILRANKQPGKRSLFFDLERSKKRGAKKGKKGSTGKKKQQQCFILLHTQ
jgi:hypothetical protein